jgi:hypothetical protein
MRGIALLPARVPKATSAGKELVNPLAAQGE